MRLAVWLMKLPVGIFPSMSRLFRDTISKTSLRKTCYFLRRIVVNLKNVSSYLMCMEMEAALSEKEKCCPGIILLGDARLPVLNVSIPDSRQRFVAALLGEDCQRGADHPPGSRCAPGCFMENTYTTFSRISLEIFKQIKFVKGLWITHPSSASSSSGVCVLGPAVRGGTCCSHTHHQTHRCISPSTRLQEHSQLSLYLIIYICKGWRKLFLSLWINILRVLEQHSTFHGHSRRKCHVFRIYTPLLFSLHGSLAQLAQEKCWDVLNSVWRNRESEIWALFSRWTSSLSLSFWGIQLHRWRMWRTRHKPASLGCFVAEQLWWHF